jgi:Zn-dependent protease
VSQAIPRGTRQAKTFSVVYPFPMSHFLNPTYIISILIAISVHEWAHAYTAHKFGDPTPERAGRLTLNPLAHIDPLGALMFIIVGFGWAKPVPVDSSYFRHPKRELSLVALAGPFSNLILAIITFTILFILTHGDISSAQNLLDAHTGSTGFNVLLQILQSSLFVNLALMAFNLFPIAPLDGSNIVRVFIPLRFEERYDDFTRIGPYILIGLIILETVLPIHILSGWVFGIMSAVLAAFEYIATLF